MSRWLKRWLAWLMIPLVAVVLTACPGPGDDGRDADEPAIENGLGAGDEADESGEDDADDEDQDEDQDQDEDEEQDDD